MGSLNSIVNVSISRQTSVPSRAGFGTGAFLSADASFVPTAKSYATYQEMVEDTSVGADALAFGAVYFGQKLVPTKLTVIRDLGGIESGDLVFDADLVTDNAIAVTLDGVEIGSVAFTTDHATTLGVVAALIEVETNVESAVSDGVDTITVTFNDREDHTLTVAVTGGLSQAVGTYTGSRDASDLTASLNAAVDVLNDWYALCIWSKVKADILEVAGWVQAQGNANPKIFFAQSSDADILDPAADTDVASTLKAGAHFRTSIWYHAEDAEYLDGGVIGGQLPTPAGSITWAYKSVSSVTVDSLSSDQKAAAHAKACNTYDVVANTNITEEGKVSDSPFEWIDVIRGVDWLQVNIAAELFQLLVNSPKIAYTNGGISLITSKVWKVLTTAVEMDILSGESLPSISAPQAQNVSAADKGNRVLNGVNFSGVLAGAVQKINVNGVVTL